MELTARQRSEDLRSARMEVLILRHRNEMKARAGSDSPKTGVSSRSVEVVLTLGVCRLPALSILLALDLLMATEMFHARSLLWSTKKMLLDICLLGDL
ncbi:hypothetical protein ElyMa_000891700 [Elysia marginata]|uniref:Uncharacterized protein n=1 Tax=Elysia marginata TaxID=1093978 RepID=A0AAV4H751_9GAST|nr:hypothetical protein ElyMa_000891700 [Elysia marginata]